MDQLLANYSEQDKSAYLALIAVLAAADRQVSQQEIAFLQLLTEGAGLADQDADAMEAIAHHPNKVDLEQCINQLKNSELKYSLVTELLNFARSDGNMSQQEEQYITSLTDRLGVSRKQYEALRDFADEARRPTQVAKT